MKKLDAKQLRVSEPSEADLKKVKRNPIYLVIDEVLDTYNIGSMFRLADAVAMEKGISLRQHGISPIDKNPSFSCGNRKLDTLGKKRYCFGSGKGIKK